MQNLKGRLDSDRLTLNSLGKADAQFVFEVMNTDGWLQFTGDRNVHSVSDAENHIQKIISDPEAHYWVVRLKYEKEAIGIITLRQRNELAHPDIGFAFLPAFREGYTCEACAEILRYIFTDNKTDSLYAITAPGNIDSIKLLKKLAFSFIEEQHLNNQAQHLYRVEADQFLISEVVHSFFSVFTNTDNQKPNINALRELCLPGALLINKKPAEVDVMDLSTFIPVRERILTDGTLRDFQEEELRQETSIVGEIAQRSSEYIKTGVLEGKRFETRGHKFFQFIKVDQSWKICSVIWTDFG
jgi:RimJ/RimL family protein N-acetyltransferase